MGLQGTIDTLPAADVLIALAAQGSSGVLEVRGDGQRLSLSLMSGSVVAGEMASLSGVPKDRNGLLLRLVDVLCVLLRIKTGGYDFRSGNVERPGEVSVSLDEVLNRARMAADALSEVANGVPSLDSIPALVESDEDGPITLNRSMLRLVSQIDSKRSLSEIGSHLG